MRTNIQRFRWLVGRLPAADQRRIVVLTGARQTGKTTLVRARFPELRYLDLDDLEVRSALRETRTASWARDVGPSVIDEAQKEPSVFEKVKHAFDHDGLSFSVLLGSSRILLLERVKETLAGRAFLYELWPLLASELRHAAGEKPPLPLLDRLLTSSDGIDAVLAGEPEILLGPEETARREAIEHLAEWGGMPELLRLDDATRHEWLRSYQKTFLERDLLDLVRLSDLEPFRTLQALCALRTGRLLSYSELARDAAVAVSTARRYLEYLHLSYQVLLLQPFRRNLTSSTVKSPKLYWLDLGVLRHLTKQRGPLTGEQFETLVVGEIHKWCSTLGREVDLHFYRTRSGLEVDLLLRTEHGWIGVEIKNRERVDRSDASALRAVGRELGAEWLGGLVVHRGGRVHSIDEDARLWAVPIHRLV